jgi:glycosyl transferase family 1
MNGSGRVCLVSQRGLKPGVSRCCAYEFEDVICGMDSVDLVVPQLRKRAIPPLGDKILRRMEQATGLSVALAERGEHVSLDHDYDLLFMVIQNVADLKCLDLVDGWRKRCKVAACWIEELWVEGLKWRDMFAPLRNFDFAFINCGGSVKPLADLVPTQCVYAPAAVDVLRFCPYPNPPLRAIDLYYMGRRSPETHNVLMRMAEDGSFNYMYDTAKLSRVFDPAEHRALLANTVKRSRYFVTNKAKVNADFQTGGQEEIGLRFFEGAAAGAVLVGDPPNCAKFSEHFDWPDAVIPVPFGSTDIDEIIGELDAQPGRVAAIRRNNITNCLRRHDWAHRWRMVLDALELTPKPATLEREAQLARLASSIDREELQCVGG